MTQHEHDCSSHHSGEPSPQPSPACGRGSLEGHQHSHHGHDHGHGHGHHHPVPTSMNKAFFLAVLLTLSYTLAEAAYGISAHAMSLLADAAHNLGDSLGLILAWLANWLLSFPARERYSYGFKRTTIIAALANAFILVASSALIAYESIYKLLHLMTVNEQVVIVVGLIGIAVNAGSSFLFMAGAKHDLNIRGAFYHLMYDAVILVGVVVSAIIISYTGYEWIDPVVGLIIVGIVLYGTLGLLQDSLHLILDAVPRYIDQTGIKTYLSGIDGVTAVHDLHIWGLSTREIALTAHLVMPDKKLSDEQYKQINEVLLHDFKINHVTLQVEGGHVDHPCQQGETC